MNSELVMALKALEKEKGIEQGVLLEALEAALISAYKKNFKQGSRPAEAIRVEINPETGEIKVFSQLEVVQEVTDPARQLSLAAAREMDARYEEGDIAELEVTPKNFGRVAAQAAKQVVLQRIREAERGIIYDEYVDRESDIITGVVQQIEQKNIMVDLGKVEAVLPPSEQIPKETYQPHDRIKAFVVEVRKTSKGPQIILSRTHPGFLKRLFELEVPEIHDGTVEIKAVAREAGSRSKIAVYSKDENVDPVGACVGPRGMRVQSIVNELKGEKIDIIRWSKDLEEFVANALSPSQVLSVEISADGKSSLVVVPDHQLSLAIGKEGQNARLAARLTNLKIDIKSDAQVQGAVLSPEPGVGDHEQA